MIIFKKRINGTIDKFVDEEFKGNFWPNDNLNPNSVEYDAWLALGNIPEFSNLENLEKAKQNKIAQCKKYLQDNDWQAPRFIETGEPIPQSVIDNKILARTLQDDINACTTLEELENININFN